MNPELLSPDAHHLLLIHFFNRGRVLIRYEDGAWGSYNLVDRTHDAFGRPLLLEELFDRGFIEENPDAEIFSFDTPPCTLYELTSGAYYYLSRQRHTPDALIDHDRAPWRGQYTEGQVETLSRLAQEVADTSSVDLVGAFLSLHDLLGGGVIGQHARTRRWRIFYYDDYDDCTSVPLRSNTFQALLKVGLITNESERTNPRNDQSEYGNWHALTVAGNSLAWDINHDQYDPIDQRLEAVADFRELLAADINAGLQNPDDDFHPRERALFWTAFTLEQENDPQAREMLQALTSVLQTLVGQYAGAEFAKAIHDLAKANARRQSQEEPQNDLKPN